MVTLAKLVAEKNKLNIKMKNLEIQKKLLFNEYLEYTAKKFAEIRAGMAKIAEKYGANISFHGFINSGAGPFECSTIEEFRFTTATSDVYVYYNVLERPDDFNDRDVLRRGDKFDIKNTKPNDCFMIKNTPYVEPIFCATLEEVEKRIVL